MTVDIEKLRALCADVPEHLTVDHRGDVVVGVDGIPAERTGVHPVGSLFPLVLRSPRGDGTTLAVAELAATARPAIVALCDRVERAEAEVDRLRAENANLREKRRWLLADIEALGGGPKVRDRVEFSVEPRVGEKGVVIKLSEDSFCVAWEDRHPDDVEWFYRESFGRSVVRRKLEVTP